MDFRLQPGFLGTGASLLADLTLMAYVLLLVPAMLVGYFFARRKWFVPHHKLTMTGIVLFNWVLILVLMQVSYREGVLPNLAANLAAPFYLLPTLHLITGAAAQFTGTYLVIRMWFENQLPTWFKVKNIKRYMRFTLAGWLVTAALGVAIYLVWYLPSGPVAAAIPAAVTPEPDAIATQEAATATSEPEAVVTPETAAATPEPEAVVTPEAAAATPQPEAVVTPETDTTTPEPDAVVTPEAAAVVTPEPETTPGS